MSRRFGIFKVETQVAEFIGTEGRLTGVRLRWVVFCRNHFHMDNCVDIVTRLLKL